MSFILFISAASQVFSAIEELPVPAGISVEIVETAQSFSDCVLQRTWDFEASREEADTVVSAAMSACREEEAIFVGNYIGEMAVKNLQSLEATETAIERFKGALTSRAIELVVRVRLRGASQ
ncbi:hypothetical protein M3P36_02890 [Altererythrobacter sp. KTW20L]|uniref:hypothetical protein n=1 Tax=Altererythrobacter sp. KTW20L TaxID=2942210 RepID=UPI0020C0A934|nr:hypothetical protein [Altererythrobacter sp. KTW20L]MCL6249998.1 hypothetical protein [Altererythrobacter sp. KTW20L]